jgi:hypothetical protein
MSPGTRIVILPSYALAGASLANALFATGANAQTYFDPGTFPQSSGPRASVLIWTARSRFGT